MIEKRITLWPTNPDTGQQNFRAYWPEAPSLLEKTADFKDYLPELREFLGKLKPDNIHVYVIINALGSGEYWSSNSNGDDFPEEGLKHDGDDFGFKTFLRAKVFRHHSNHDPENSIGDVLFSGFNPHMHRVELVARIHKGKAPKTAGKIAAGDFPPCSMGCRIDKDVCSVCGHESKKIAEYCDHLRNHMGDILPSGLKVAAINPRPNFFDISEVLVGADKTSWVMAKVASGAEVLDTDEAFWRLPSWKIAETLRLAEDKTADIEKQIPATVEVVDLNKKLLARKVKQAALKLSASEPRFTKSYLKKLSNHSLGEVLSTFSYLGIPFRPSEFQHLALLKLGAEKVADALYDQGYELPAVGTSAHVFPFGAHLVREEIAKLACPVLETRSLLHPFLIGRAKVAADHSGIQTRKLLAPHIQQSSLLEKVALAQASYSNRLERLYGTDEGRASMLSCPVTQCVISQALWDDPLQLKTAALLGETEIARALFLSVALPTVNCTKLATQSIQSRIRDLPLETMSPEALTVLEPDEAACWLVERLG